MSLSSFWSLPTITSPQHTRATQMLSSSSTTFTGNWDLGFLEVPMASKYLPGSLYQSTVSLQCLFPPSSALPVLVVLLILPWGSEVTEFSPISIPQEHQSCWGSQGSSLAPRKLPQALNPHPQRSSGEVQPLTHKASFAWTINSH